MMVIKNDQTRNISEGPQHLGNHRDGKDYKRRALL